VLFSEKINELKIYFLLILKQVPTSQFSFLLFMMLVRN